MVASGYVRYLVKKYGVVPKSAMPETANSLQHPRWTRISHAIRSAAKRLRETATAGESLSLCVR